MRVVRSVALFCLALLLAATGCASSTKSNREGPSPADAAPTSRGATAVAGPASDPLAVSGAWNTFFSPKTSVAVKERLLEDGARYHAVLVAQSKSAAAKLYTAKAKKVDFVDANHANVTFDIFGKGTKPVLADQKGQAVRQDGRWKVASDTFCGLIALNTGAGAGCPK
jgi:hypothetical protein